MNRFIRSFAITVAAVVLSVTPVDSSETQDKKSPQKVEPRSTIMKKKLAEAQKLLEGLALQDFNKISAAADELAILRNEAAWMIIKSKEYEIFSWDFSRQIEAAKRAAKAKNVGAAALAYVDMTLTCVKCHKYVREEGIALNLNTRDRYTE